ncbi:IclR family transcriptional regulator [Microbacterium sp. CFH 90308]|uniref:IclR family transcriptional regulator n=1 Tax=Microbacterium salsuginis TaxID=2722803 RepID=A0ABX1KAY1_9MICO|nr:IclR family transcriptional regulator [Microbacterium sp. CFH 90308]NLP84182.1 IclR family transcriptional regulator [Microbacterium sp. CFH 90308]
MEPTGPNSEQLDSPAGGRAVERALSVLELAAASGGRLRLTDIADKLGIPKSSAHNLLGSLTRTGWLERNPRTREFSLGVRAWEIGHAYVTLKPLTQRAQPVMDSLRDLLGETVRLSVLVDTDNLCVAKSSGTHPLIFDQPVGARLPAHATGLGKALLSGLTTEQITALYPDDKLDVFTSTTLATVRDLEMRLEEARSQGWVEDHGEYVPGIWCVAVPIRDEDDAVVGAMSVSFPVERFAAESEHARRALLQAAAEVSRRLGASHAVIGRG